MSRFFINKKDIAKDRITITGDDASHMRKVLRLAAGDMITLCDGNGNDYTAMIEKIGPEGITTGIMSVMKSKTEPPVEITLFQGIPKSDKMDFIIQKSVELGVKSIVPMNTERTVVKFGSNKDIEKKLARWRRISMEAAKQCNRGVIPEVLHPVDFDNALKLLNNDGLVIFPYENEKENKLMHYLCKTSTKKVSVIIGPEGGFSEKEVNSAKLAGILPVTLGPRILRTETAGIFVLSVIMYQIGDVGV